MDDDSIEPEEEQDIEQGDVNHDPLQRKPVRKNMEYTTAQTLLMAYQTLGVVYGDIGTSPLYTFPSIGISNPGEVDILGILSLVYWTLTVMALIKYVFIVLRANDHGEGGTFALYSLLRQHINFKNKSIVPVTARLESDVNLLYHSNHSKLQSKTHKFLEGSKIAQTVLTLIVLVGTCMVIGDGALTPAISVLSAVQGIQSRSSKITQEHVVLLSVVILFLVFLFQRLGTSKVGFTFSPIMIIWFGSIALIGLFNIIKFYPPVLKAISPHYIYHFFKRNRRKGWELLGAIVLCITGAEAMFADLGHFNTSSIQIAFSGLVYPALILGYGGEAAFLIKNPDKMSTAFYSSVPEPVFWPMFIIATLAAVVASQSLISASFSIIRQSMALGCFPRVTMNHTSGKYEGQVYSPEVNYFLMVLSILITVGFKGGVEIGNAYGVAVIWVMLITTFLMVVVMLVIWDTNIFLVGIFFAVFLAFEGTYMTSLLNKVPQGGWVPFGIAAFFLIITLSWTYGRGKKSEYEAEKKMSQKEFRELLASTEVRVPGICFFCTDLMNGYPPIVRHYVQHVGALRQVMVFVTVRMLPVKSVLPEERFAMAKLDADGVYRCLVQYGYKDEPDIAREEFLASVITGLLEKVESAEEAAVLGEAMNRRVVFVLGRIVLKMREDGRWFKRLVINTFYRFLQKNCRSIVATLKIPPGKVLRVEMVYEI
ncbi:hypothetical protein J5N97_005449 [Dioscorea zingiberensis]|uniref:Potassium transporter n=1 Tax=Dioscorea zingiberensis TaxID=325984 RepID=A0A9D5HS85_9LILI|nr:hypothetical protein J5N97_005449 [Dioscorea zingiberensis]